jgi:uncharacterized protein (TIGR02145 family)
MKKNEFFSIWLLLSLCTVAVFLSSFDKSATPESVVINGVRWATCNVDQPGTFAASPEFPGMFYQWNRKKGWPATGSVTGWDNSYPTGTEWEEAEDPSPVGYRVPTLDEIKSLFDEDKVSNEWTTVNGVNGRKFTDLATRNSIFLPAAGHRGNYDGTLGGDGTDGCYWSRTANGESRAYYLNFNSDGADWFISGRNFGRNVRPVVFHSSFDKSATPESVLINGVRWATCNVDEPGTFAASPESPGMFYQWNREKGWAAIGSVNSWDYGYPTGTEWEKANDPSPVGYRVPTLDEIKSLFDEDKVSNEWTTVNGINGRKFTDLATGNSIFLPAVGFRCDGSLRRDARGIYWSGTANENYENIAYTVLFYSNNAGWNGDSRYCGFSVRPVAE